MKRAEAVSLMNKRRDAWLNRDLDGYLSLFADDFVFYAGGVEQTRGRTALAEAVEHNYEQFNPISWDFHEIAVHGQNVLAEWTVTQEERASGARRSLKAMFICEIRDGLATWVREYRAPIG
jgi:uncharacterized protein (TIGR02246 family)